MNLYFQIFEGLLNEYALHEIEEEQISFISNSLVCGFYLFKLIKEG